MPLVDTENLDDAVDSLSLVIPEGSGGEVEGGGGEVEGGGVEGDTEDLNDCEVMSNQTVEEQHALPAAAMEAAADGREEPTPAAGTLPWLSCRGLSRHSRRQAYKRGLMMGTWHVHLSAARCACL